MAKDLSMLAPAAAGSTRSIPQIEHEPGAACRICGCIGQV
jgi:hypothetical protein